MESEWWIKEWWTMRTLNPKSIQIDNSFKRNNIPEKIEEDIMNNDDDVREEITKEIKESNSDINTFKERERIKEKFRDKKTGKLHCAFCGCTNELLHTIDHKIPLSIGGEDKEENMQVLCFICNMLKGSSNMEDFAEIMMAYTILKKHKKMKLLFPEKIEMKYNQYHYRDFIFVRGDTNGNGRKY